MPIAATPATAKKDSISAIAIQPESDPASKANSVSDSLAKNSLFNNITLLNAFNFNCEVENLAGHT